MTAPDTAVLSFSRIARDTRVLRQCAALAERGALKLVIGYAEPEDTLPWPFAHEPLPRPTTRTRLSTLLRQVPARLGAFAAERGFWAASRHRWALAQLRSANPRRVVANDWPALVVAARRKREDPTLRIHYDSHEFATLEFDERRYWRIAYKPFVAHLEAAHIGAADVVSTVGPRLAAALREHYALRETPVVIRNIPDRIAIPPRAAGWPLALLFHGQILPDRGLEALLDSMARWTTPHHLTIRGSGAEAYIESLRRRAPAPERVRFEPAVPPDQVMRVAAESADVGVHVTPLGTTQRHFSMPNKLFEYIGAGLAVVVSPGADLKALVEAHGVGVVAADAGAEAVADAINALDPARVEQFRAAAREAAATLCWQHERKLFQAVQDRLAGQAPSCP